jgi:hypothetical protein
MNYDFLAHIIRDLFSNRNFTLIYGADQILRIKLLEPQHSVGAFQLHTERSNIEDTFEYRFWEAGINNPFVNYGDVDLFISINYKPNLYFDNSMKMGLQVKNLLKPGGKAMVVNPGSWARDLKTLMRVDGVTTREARRYSILRDQDILIYENI